MKRSLCVELCLRRGVNFFVAWRIADRIFEELHKGTTLENSVEKVLEEFALPISIREALKEEIVEMLRSDPVDVGRIDVYF